MSLPEHTVPARDLPDTLRLAIRRGRTTPRTSRAQAQDHPQPGTAIRLHQNALALLQVLSIRLEPLIQAYNTATQVEEIPSHITQQITPGIAGRRGPRLALQDICNGTTVYSIDTRPTSRHIRHLGHTYEIELPRERLNADRRYQPAPTYPSAPQVQAYIQQCLRAMQEYLATGSYDGLRFREQPSHPESPTPPPQTSHPENRSQSWADTHSPDAEHVIPPKPVIAPPTASRTPTTDSPRQPARTTPARPASQ